MSGGRLVGAVGLSLRLLRLGGRRAWTAAGLMAAGVAVGTLLLAVAVGALHGWDERESRTGWRPAAQGPETVDVPASAVALVRTTSDRVAGQPLQIVDVAGVAPAAEAPPGLPHVPAPGELWVSPALAELMRELPADRLADRFGGVAPAGTIAVDGLRDPAELVAVRGAAVPLPGGVALDSFAGSPLQLDEIEVYRQLTVVAVVLMGVPAVGLLGAAARLSAARRVQRLAALRLLGAGAGQVTVVAVAEVAVVAAGAAVVGVAAQWLLAPALAAIELGGSGWYADDLRPSPVALLLVVAAGTVLATLAAIGGTRRVVVGPLGVARRDRPGGARLVRLLGVAAAIAVFAAANTAMRTGSPDVAGLVFGGGVLALFGAASLVGPLVVRLCGRAMARSARTPAVLLAGRRLLDDPKGAFRPMAGLTLAVFVAGFLAPLTAAISGALDGDDAALWMDPRAGQPAAVAQVVQQRLADQGLVAEVTTTSSRVGVVPGPGVDRDRVRTALAPIAPGSALLTDAEQDGQDGVLVGDLVRGALVVLAGTFLLAATSAGTTAAARVLDQRDTLRRLHLAGTPLAVLDAARRIETVRPLLVNAAIALTLGLICAAPFVAVTRVVEPAALVLLGSVLAIGLVLVVLASAASRPLLRAVTAERGGDE